MVVNTQIADTQSHRLADLYAGLADIFAEAGRIKVPPWLEQPGRNWPLYAAANGQAAQLEAPSLRRAAETMGQVPSGSRLSGCKALFAGNGRPPIMLYESWHVDGRFPSPTTFSVQAVYRKAGLEPKGELPDHAAVELEFLSFLAEREAEDTGRKAHWRNVRRKFLKGHANRWLPQVAQRLVHSEDEAWSAVGLLLASVLTLPERGRIRRGGSLTALPALTVVEECTLCGFCVQSCPTRALRISEDERATRLFLLTDSCIHCGKCAQVCDERVMVMDEAAASETTVLLRESARLACPLCEQPTVSETEMNAIVSRLGEHPAWLDYCIQCR